MILNNIKMPGDDSPVNIGIKGEKIENISPYHLNNSPDILQLKFDGAIAFPGLINSHDHLDFNLFPSLGNKIYSNYTEWGNYIHKNYKEEIAEVLKIPTLLRSRWGMYKNLLCGVTTVVNHGEHSGTKNDLITVFEQCHCLHSVGFEKNWKFKLNNPNKLGLPVAIHTGEGDDWLSYKEIDQLTWWNLLRRKLIGIHAVAMSESQAKKFKALIWCPQSNFFLLNKTAKINLLKKHTVILFGTDSTLTSNWNIWEHLHLARETNQLNDEELYNTVNKNASDAWQLHCGEIAPGKDADIVIAKLKHGKSDLNSFFSLRPADLLLVIQKGNIRLFDEKLLPQLKTLDLNDFSKIYITGACKYVQGDLPGLMEKIREYNPTVDFPISIERPP